VSVFIPISSVPEGWTSGGVHTNCVIARDVTLQGRVPIVTFTSDSSLARFKFSPWKIKYSYCYEYFHCCISTQNVTLKLISQLRPFINEVLPFYTAPPHHHLEYQNRLKM
jgi:hypothetical protein